MIIFFSVIPFIPAHSMREKEKAADKHGTQGSPKIVFQVPDLSQNDYVCVSMWGWLPNGSLVQLSKACAAGGTVPLPARRINDYLAAWRASFTNTHTNPNKIRLGILAFIALTKPGKGIYGYVKTIVLGTDGIHDILVAGLTSAEVKSMLKKPLVPWKKLVDHKTTSGWPPGTITSGTPGAEWELERVIAAKQDAPIPVTMLRLTGYLRHFTKDTASLHLHLEAGRNKQIVFEAIAAISAGSLSIENAEWKVAGPIMILSMNKTLLSLTIISRYDSYADPLYNGSDLYLPIGPSKSFIDVVIRRPIAPEGPNGDVILAAGYKGDLAVAEYCLRTKTPIPLPQPCLAEAVISLTRPKIVWDLMYYWYEIDNNPEDGRGVAEKIFYRLVENGYWARTSSYTVQGTLATDYLAAHNVYNTNPVLSAAIPVAALLTGEGSVPFYAGPDASLGLRNSYTDILLARVQLDAYNEADVLYKFELMHPAKKVYYADHLYTLGAPYYDVEVIKPGSAAPPPPPGQPHPNRNRDQG